MPSVSPLLHTAVRNTRRVRGRVKISSARVDGLAPTAVVTAIKQAAFGRPNAEERAWIKCIELMRALLLTSPAPSEIIDFGAGTAHQFDTGAALTKNTVTKTLGAMTTSSKPPRWAYLLFRLVRELRPQSVLEMGACVGISASYEAAALELNGAGRLLTLEGAEVLADRSAQTLGELNLGHRAEVRLGQFADTIEPASAALSPLGVRVHRRAPHRVGHPRLAGTATAVHGRRGGVRLRRRELVGRDAQRLVDDRRRPPHCADGGPALGRHRRSEQVRDGTT
jgi:hypothetical protein